MVDVETVISLLLAQAPLVAIAVTVLYYTLDKKIESLDRKIESIKADLERKIEVLGREIKDVKDAFYSYENTLIDFLAVKGVVAESQAVLLRGALRSLVPLAKSKYYTEEVRKRLIELLDKEIGDYTWSDIDELEKIAEAIRKEAWETGREDLRKYYPLLMMYTAMLRGILRRREIEKRRSDREKPQD